MVFGTEAFSSISMTVPRTSMLSARVNAGIIVSSNRTGAEPATSNTFRSTVSSPCFAAVTSYFPGPTSAKEIRPFSSVWPDLGVVPTPASLTSTRLIAAPFASRTRTSTVAVSG